MIAATDPFRMADLAAASSTGTPCAASATRATEITLFRTLTEYVAALPRSSRDFLKAAVRL